MIYCKKVPPTDSNMSETLLSNGWVKIKEPRNLFFAIVMSVPFIIMNAAIVIYFVPPIKIPLVEILNELENEGITFSIDLRLLFYVIVIFAFLVVHELLHAIFIPKFIKSKKTFWGITPFGGFVSTTEEISKLRFVLISICPFITLSVVMPLFFSLIGLYSDFVTFLVIMNALGSSVDILNMLLIIFQVPNYSRIINNGLETYHKCFE